MNFKVDKTTVIEGDIIEVSWNCLQADSVTLYIDNGYKKSAIPLDKSGVKRFRLNRSKGKTILTLEAIEGKKQKESHIKIRVNPMQVTQSETVYPNGKTGVWQGIKFKFKEFQEKCRLAWRQLPPKKQMAFKILGLIVVGLLLSFLAPIFFGVLLIGLLVYLVVILLRR